MSGPLSRQIRVLESGILLGPRNSPPAKSKYLKIGKSDSQKNFSEQSWDVNRGPRGFTCRPPPYFQLDPIKHVFYGGHWPPCFMGVSDPHTWGSRDPHKKKFPFCFFFVSSFFFGSPDDFSIANGLQGMSYGFGLWLRVRVMGMGILPIRPHKTCVLWVL